MNKSMVLPIALSLLTFTLDGCGGEDDGIYGSGSNKITLTSFDNSYDTQA